MWNPFPFDTLSWMISYVCPIELNGTSQCGLSSIAPKLAPSPFTFYTSGKIFTLIRSFTYPVYTYPVNLFSGLGCLPAVLVGLFSSAMALVIIITFIIFTIIVIIMISIIIVFYIEGEHLGWYGGLATALMERGLLVVGHDHQVFHHHHHNYHHNTQCNPQSLPTLSHLYNKLDVIQKSRSLNVLHFPFNWYDISDIWYRYTI